MQDCPNCASPVTDRFCAHCGQRSATRLVSVHTLILDVLEDQFTLEARLPRTLGALLGRPGRLTAEYTAGRVARYIPPFRLYLVSGLLFFFAVSWIAPFDVLWRRLAPYADELTGQPVAGATIEIVRLPIDTLRVPSPLLPLARHYLQQEARINALPPREGARVAYSGVFANVSAVLLLLVPLFALVVKALYPRRLYIEHVIFILHVHSAGFLIALLPLFVRSAWTAGPVLLWLLAYLFLALRGVYGQSAVRTAAKFAALVVLYSVALAMIGVAMIVAAVLRF